MLLGTIGHLDEEFISQDFMTSATFGLAAAALLSFWFADLSQPLFKPGDRTQEPERQEVRDRI